MNYEDTLWTSRIRADCREIKGSCTPLTIQGHFSLISRFEIELFQTCETGVLSLSFFDTSLSWFNLRKFKSKIDPRYQKNSDEKKQRKNRE
jgi:hypothetical protein